MELSIYYIAILRIYVSNIDPKKEKISSTILSYAWLKVWSTLYYTWIETHVWIPTIGMGMMIDHFGAEFKRTKFTLETILYYFMNGYTFIYVEIYETEKIFEDYE